MSDPVSTSTLILAAAGGAAVKTLVEKTWSAGEKLIEQYFRDHQPKALAAAEQNAKDFLNRLAERVGRMEEQQQVDRQVIEDALNDPSFGAILHDALIHSAQSGSESKHDLLSRLVAARLTTQSESRLANVIPLACSAVASLIPSQVAVLAFHAALNHAATNFSAESETAKDVFLEESGIQFEKLLGVFAETFITWDDLQHLSATGCGTVHMMSMPTTIREKWKSGSFTLGDDELRALPFIKQRFKGQWSGLLTMFSPSTIGTLIGLVALEATGATVAKDWEKC